MLMKTKNKIIGMYTKSANKSAAKYWRESCGVKCRAQRSDKGKKRRKF